MESSADTPAMILSVQVSDSGTMQSGSPECTCATPGPPYPTVRLGTTELTVSHAQSAMQNDVSFLLPARLTDGTYLLSLVRSGR